MMLFDAGRKPSALFVSCESLPPALLERAQWVCWHYVWRQRKKDHEAKWTKAPYRPDGRPASSTDPRSWSSFDACRHAYDSLHELHDFDGIGYVLTADDGWTFFDLDHCRQPRGRLTAPAQAIVSAIDSYTEVTPGGRGLRIVAAGIKPSYERHKQGWLELYDGRRKNGEAGGRFLTLTGHHLNGTPTTIEQRQDAIAALYQQTFPPAPAVSAPPQPVAQPTPLSAAAILQLAQGARNGAKFTQLWSGDWSSYPSHSEADLALCRLLAFWLGPDPERIDCLFRQSGLMRDKWRGDYAHTTIARALAAQRVFYQPGYSGGQATVKSTNSKTPAVLCLTVGTVYTSPLPLDQLAAVWRDRPTALTVAAQLRLPTANLASGATRQTIPNPLPWRQDAQALLLMEEGQPFTLHDEESKESYSLDQLALVQQTGKPLARRGGPEQFVWQLRLLTQAKLLKLPKVDLPPCPKDASAAQRKVYQGFRRLWRYKQAVREWAGKPTAFSIPFVQTWCDVGSFATAHETIRWLVQRGIIHRVRTDASRAHLYLPGPAPVPALVQQALRRLGERGDPLTLPPGRWHQLRLRARSSAQLSPAMRFLLGCWRDRRTITK